MGTSVSKNLELSSNDYLLKFVSNQKITPNDPFWNRLVAFNLTAPTTSNDQLALESRIEQLCQSLLKNNLTTGNFGSLLEIFISRSSELQTATNTDASLFTWQLYNILFIIRCILKFLIETVTEEQLIEQIEFGTNGGARLETFVGTLVGILVDVPVNDNTYGIHLESVTAILVLLSVQLGHSGRKSDQSNIYRLIMRGRHVINAPVLVKCLLGNFIEQKKPPVGNSGHSLVLGLAAELWSMLTFSRSSDDTLTENERTDYQKTPLATQSLLLTLVLVHHWTTKNNPYRISLFSCMNNEDNSPQLPTKTPTLFKVDYSALYATICKKATGDATTLLLYLLLHRNDSFKKYLLNRLDLDQLIIPILKTLYNAPNSNSHHIYMSLIILLILSEDDSFNKSIHETKLRNIVWYTERTLTEVSLGGLLVLVIIRTVQYNMLKMRDKYLHTNCLAALANMSAQFRDLHPYVSQRLVSLFETLARRYQKLAVKLSNGTGDKSELSINVSQDGASEDVEQDVTVLEEVLRMVLEILNSCLSNQLVNNPNLVYTLLYNKTIFEHFKDNVAFQDIIHNIEVIISYFSSILNDKTQHNEVDATQVLGVIQQGAKQWPKEKLKKFPDLKFKYVEEDQPEEFFIPYVWSLVSQQSILHWTSDNTQLLTAVC